MAPKLYHHRVRGRVENIEVVPKCRGWRPIDAPTEDRDLTSEASQRARVSVPARRGDREAAILEREQEMGEPVRFIGRIGPVPIPTVRCDLEGSSAIFADERVGDRRREEHTCSRAPTGYAPVDAAPQRAGRAQGESEISALLKPVPQERRGPPAPAHVPLTEECTFKADFILDRDVDTCARGPLVPRLHDDAPTAGVEPLS